MAEEKKVPAQAKKANPSGWEKFVNGLKKLPQTIAKPFKDMYYELKRVSPPVKAMVSSIIMHTCWPPHSGTGRVMFSSRA